jgi:hypothetical protein
LVLLVLLAGIAGTTIGLLRARAASRQSQRLLASSYLDRGVNELEHGDRARGYAILGQAYRAASDDPDLRASAGALLGAWDL